MKNSKPIGVDSKGRIRFRNSKKNPVMFTQGIFFVSDNKVNVSGVQYDLVIQGHNK